MKASGRVLTAVVAISAGAAAGWAQTKPVPETQEKPKAEAKPQAKADEQQPRKKKAGEGIQVHGHWTVEVRDPDGTVRKHDEFENNLTQNAYGGSNLLALLLLGYAVAQYNGFTVFLNAGSGSGVEMYQGSSPTCLSGYTCGPNLRVTPAGTLPYITGFTLTGSATNASGSMINVTSVSTAVGTCPFSITTSGTTDSPVGCVGSSDMGASFSFTSFPYTVSIGPGEIVAASVQISFM